MTCAISLMGRHGLLWLILGVGVVFFPPAVGFAGDEPPEVSFDTELPIPTLDSQTYRRGDHKVILITDHGLSPPVAMLKTGQLVAWNSYSRVPAIVVFDAEVARSMVCHNLVNFSIESNKLMSAQIHTGDFASFCELEPGRYPYTVFRSSGNVDEGVDLERQLHGEIVVGKPDAAD